MEPIFTDKEVRDVMNLHKWRATDRATGRDTEEYELCKALRNVVEGKVSNSLDSILQEVFAWQKITFPHATPQSIANHLLSEALELKATPTDAEEIADVAMLISALAHWQGIDLAEVVKQKLEVNKRRKWGNVNAEGYVEHIRGN